MPSTNADTLRVLLVTPDYPPTHGGIQRLLHRITEAMPNAETRVLTIDSTGAEAWDKSNGVNVTRVRVPQRRAAVRNAAFNALGYRKAPKWNPDVVLNGHVVTGPLAARLAKRYGAANILYTYGKEVDGRPGMTRWTLARSVGAVSVADYTRQLMAEACGGSLPRPVEVVHPGTQVPLSLGAADADRPTIVTTSRLRDWYKGHDVTMKALPAVRNALPDVHWVIIGDGRIRPELEAMRDNLGLQSNVTFLGAVDDETRDEWMARAHVFSMPARYPKDEVGGEGFPVVYLEAAGWGLPTVAGNVGGPTEAVVHGETGLLVNPESPEEVAGALIELLSDPAYGRKLGLASRARAEKSFTWEAVGAQLESVLRKMSNVR